jgi:hypothetical protein
MLRSARSFVCGMRVGSQNPHIKIRVFQCVEMLYLMVRIPRTLSMKRRTLYCLISNFGKSSEPIGSGAQSQSTWITNRCQRLRYTLITNRWHRVRYRLITNRWHRLRYRPITNRWHRLRYRLITNRWHRLRYRWITNHWHISAVPLDTCFSCITWTQLTIHPSNTQKCGDLEKATRKYNVI